MEPKPPIIVFSELSECNKHKWAFLSEWSSDYGYFVTIGGFGLIGMGTLCFSVPRYYAYAFKLIREASGMLWLY